MRHEEESCVMSGAEGARRRRTPRRGGSTRDERRARPQVRTEPRNVCHKVKLLEGIGAAAHRGTVRDERRRRRAQEKNIEAR